MAESCDRIVYNLRHLGLRLDVVHLSPRARHFQLEKVWGGDNFIFPQEEDPAHSLNQVWAYLNRAPQRPLWTQLVAFGGYLPLLATPVYAAWLGLPFLTLLRGNDFDTAIFYPQRREVLREALQQSAGVCAVSQDKIEKIRALYPGIKTFYTPNGIDPGKWYCLENDLQKAYTWRKTYVPTPRKVIGMFGQLKAKKGILFFMKALSQSGMASLAHLLFIGDLNPEVEAFLGEYPDKFSYSVYPFQERYTLLPYYAACDVVAIPSFYDGLPNVLMESASLGIPMLASQVAGMADLLEDGKHGFLFEVGDLADCVRAIRRFFASPPEDLALMGNNAQKMMREQYTHQQEALRYIDVFQSVFQK